MDNCENSTLKSDTLKSAPRAETLKKSEPPEVLAKKKLFTLLLCFKGFARRPDEDSARIKTRNCTNVFFFLIQPCFYRCSVQFVFYFSNTPTNAHI